MHLKARLEGVDIEKMRQLLFEFAEVGHQLIRCKQTVDKAESIGVAELNEQEQIDKDVMLKISLKTQQEEVATKTALFSLVADSPKGVAAAVPLAAARTLERKTMQPCQYCRGTGGRLEAMPIVQVGRVDQN